MSSTPATIALRPIQPDDRDLLFAIYASTRAEELAQLDWPEAQKAAFLTMQFEAQHAHYMKHFAGAAFQIVVVYGEGAGRLYVYRTPAEIRIVDIALLPRFRGQGIGSQLMGEILTEAAQTRRAVRIHVEAMNQALRFYTRHGFRRIGEHGIYYLMEWRPPADQGRHL